MLSYQTNKSAKSVMTAFETLMDGYGEHFEAVFKTITTDNGSEFAALSSLEKAAETLVYYAHPYTSCDKGSVERHNGLIRRFILKGKRILTPTRQKTSLIFSSGATAFLARFSATIVQRRCFQRD